MLPLDEKAVRADLERTARKITSQKLWPILDAAGLVGYSYTNLDIKLTHLGWLTPRLGGRKHVYALDLLELWEEMNEMEWPELRSSWCARFQMAPPVPPKKYRQGNLL